jgi:hypothetical protein
MDSVGWLVGLCELALFVCGDKPFVGCADFGSVSFVIDG